MMRLMEQRTGRRIVPAGRKLRELVDALGISVPVFCQRHRLPRIQVQKLMNGERHKQINVKLAVLIMRAFRLEAERPHGAAVPSIQIEDFVIWSAPLREKRAA